MANRLPRMVLLLIIRAYQLGLSPLIGPVCRYDPSCSEYARQAIARHGARAGVALAARRVLRCHPWHPGGHDPVPDDLPATRRELSCVARV